MRSLGITFTTTSGGTTVELALAGLRGDIHATITLDGTNPANGIDAWRNWTEYGQPTPPATADTGGTAGAGYGWLGQHERATLEALGITLMGARLYNQTTALFTSFDPVFWGNETTYAYPNDGYSHLAVVPWLVKRCCRARWALRSRIRVW